VADRSAAALRVVSDPRPPPAIPSTVLGTLLFIFTEIMVFAGMLSAFHIARAQAVLGWPPPGQPRLPVEETAFNTAVLLLSGALLFWSGRLYKRDKARARTPLVAAIGLGAFFVVFQGAEWVALIRQGLTLTATTHGAFFYLIIGCHALHAIGALIALGMVLGRYQRDILNVHTFAAARTFWYFVVLVWPVLYAVVYL
jgi:heme/copper-type cytochrome/quinol oxidase subunit 3